ncbi:MAG: MFS transporter [Candidatus Bathyarchaeia archaeon]
MEHHNNSDNKSTHQTENKVLKPSLALYGTAASTFFSDSLLWSFLFPYAVVLGVSFAQMGLMRSARNLCQNVFQVGWGGLSEKFGKRVFVLFGYLLSGFLMVSYLIFQEPLQLLILVILQSVFWSVAVPAWNALLGDYTKKETRGRVLGKIGAVSRFSGVGATVLVASITYTTLGETTPSSFIVPFVLAAGASMVGALLVVFTREVKLKASSWRKADVFLPIRDKSFRLFLVANGLHWFTMAFAWPLFPYVTIDIVHATVWQIAIISTASGLVTALTQPKLGSIADKIGRKPVLVVGRAAFFMFPLLYAFSTSWLHLLAIHLILSFFTSAVMVTTTTYILDSAPAARRATYTASYNLIFGLATFLGSLVGGMFADGLSALNGIQQTIFTGLIISAIMRLIASTSFLKIKETLHERR